MHAAARQRFVGREAELAWLDALLEPAGATRVAFVHGAPGVGKSTLLETWAHDVRQRGVRVGWLDGRDTPASPGAFKVALRYAFDPEGGLDLADSLADEPVALLIIDTFERLAAAERWLYATLLPGVPASLRVAIAGRRPPAPAWRTSLAWQPLLSVASLRNFSAAETSRFLASRGLPTLDVAAVQRACFGHPLTMALMVEAEARAPGHTPFDAGAEDLLDALVVRLTDEVPDAVHRRALEVAAVARVTSEPLLRAILDLPEAHAMYRWLAALGFMAHGPVGLAPHELVRKALLAELARRDEAWRAELYRRATDYYMASLDPQAPVPRAQATRGMLDLAWLHRGNPVAERFFRWAGDEGLALDSAAASDFGAIEAAIAAQEGAEGGRWARYWWRERPGAFSVVRDPVGRVTACCVLLDLGEADLTASHPDPAVAAFAGALAADAPLRGDERAIYTRFWLDLERGQVVSASQSLLWVQTLICYAMTPRLAYSLATFRDATFWAPIFRYMEFEALPTADFDQGDRRLGAWGHDWRRGDYQGWQELMFQRALHPSAVRPETARDPVVVLSRDAFDDAVRQALRDLGTPESLTESPLCRSQLVLERAGAGASLAQRVPVLAELIEEAAGAMLDDPRTASWFRAIDRTWLRPIGTQRVVAERLAIPFSTYRRHLARGEAFIAERLWRRETGMPVVARDG